MTGKYNINKQNVKEVGNKSFKATVCEICWYSIALSYVSYILKIDIIYLLIFKSRFCFHVDVDCEHGYNILYILTVSSLTN